MKPEIINGKSYQPTLSGALKLGEHACKKCVFYSPQSSVHDCDVNIAGVSRCFAISRHDNKDVYYIDSKG